MPTNEKSECLCHCHVHKDCGGSPDYICECACKLAEAKKLLNNWEKRGYGYNRFQVQNLLAAQDLISYERGREEQRKRDAEFINKFSKEHSCAQCNRPLFLGSLENQIRTSRNNP